jgi:SOS-response transcriptional repressor LexA
MGSTETNLKEVVVITDNLSKNLSFLMARDGISESDLARALKIPYNTIRRINSGFTTDPRMSTLKAIAGYFNVSLDDLTEEKNPSFYSSASNSPPSVPIFNWEDISNPSFLNTSNLSNWPDWQPIALASTEDLSNQAYALKSKRSMQPRFPTGTVFIVDPNKEPIDGDLVLVKMIDSNDVSLRDLIIDPPIWHLLPVLKNFPTLSYEKNKHQIIGIVMLTIMQARKA